MLLSTILMLLGQTRVDDDFQSTKIDLDGLKRNANEPEYKFMKRVERITHQRRLEAQFAAKYNVDIVRDQNTGAIKLKKKPKDEIEELMKKNIAEARSGKKKFTKTEEVSDVPPKLSSLQKLQLKKKSKKQTKEDEKSRVFAEYQHDTIKFGETVLAPPTLITPRRATKSESARRPGMSNNLLLAPMLRNGETVSTSKQPKIFKIKGPIDKKGKRKNLPNSTRMALEAERLNAVDMYRQLKKKQPIVKITNKNLEDF